MNTKKTENRWALRVGPCKASSGKQPFFLRKNGDIRLFRMKQQATNAWLSMEEDWVIDQGLRTIIVKVQVTVEEI